MVSTVPTTTREPTVLKGPRARSQLTRAKKILLGTRRPRLAIQARWEARAGAASTGTRAASPTNPRWAVALAILEMMAPISQVIELSHQ